MCIMHCSFCVRGVIPKCSDAQKRVKNPKKSAIIDHILLEGHNATYDDFSILTTENNEFKLHLKELLLIKRDKSSYIFQTK